MARPGLTKHRKFLRLARLLNSRLLAMGALELVWQRAYEHGPDLGEPLDVEFGVGWTGDPGQLADALVESGFVDVTDGGALVVHDLDDHAPAYYRKRKAREAARCAAGESVTSQRLVSDAQTDALPHPLPHPHPKIKNMSADADPPAPAETDGFDAFWDAYPKHTAKADAVKAWRKLKPSPALQGIILAAIEDQKTWRQWREGFVPHPATWLHGKRWDDERPVEDRPSRASPPGPPVVVSTETWVEARQRQLAEAKAARQA